MVQINASALAAVVEGLVPTQITETRYGKLRWYGFGEWAWMRPAWDKGHGVNDWIDTLEPGSVLWDVGANIGVYTLYAAARGLRVVAFEPEAGSFYVLQKNLDLNGFHDRVTALNIAVSSTDGVKPFELAHHGVARAQHRLVETRGDVVARDLMTMTADRLTDFVPYPDHIKVDVDGAELSVVTGLGGVLRRAQSAVIECRDNGDADKVRTVCEQCGLEQSRVELSFGGPVRDVFFTRPLATAHF